MKRGIAICHYNRQEHLANIVDAVRRTAPTDARIVVCDDGSDRLPLRETTPTEDPLVELCGEVLLLRGPNKGVAANKNRALWALQDCQFICILEDDLIPTQPGWFEAYEQAAILSGINHFCRVQDKEVPETIPAFSAFMNREAQLTPIYGSRPRGDLTFLTSIVVQRVGAFNPNFLGAGYAHGEWSDRVARAGLINHPLRWVDIREGRDRFEQIGDTEGGRWIEDQRSVEDQLKRNAQVLKELRRNEYTYHPLVLE
jgi:glycosyltransferase involved in cell wall biosynthesis